MAILFAVVARGSTILAQHAGCAGNFIEVTEQVLAKISPETSKLTYSHGSYLFHYISENNAVYLCITDDDFERSLAFSFLMEIKRRFQTQYGTRIQTALAYAMNSEFSRVLAAQMQHCNQQSMRSVTSSRVEQVRSEVDELKDIMVRNIDNIASRGERLELLVDKTEDLSNNSVTFRKTSRNLARSMWWKNVKITIIVVIVVIYFTMFLQKYCPQIFCSSIVVMVLIITECNTVARRLWALAPAYSQWIKGKARHLRHRFSDVWWTGLAQMCQQKLIV